MTRRGRIGWVAGLVAAALVLPASASAHAALLRTVPSASRLLAAPPPLVALIYSEPVEPRFAIVSVTDAGGRPETTGSPRRSHSNPDELQVLIRRVPQGWYLVFWRVISVDGHPVRGAFTFAVGPSPGPAPQFVLPSTTETAATPSLLVARWLVFLSTMGAIGLFVLRIVLARPLVRLVKGSSLRAISLALWIVLGIALAATPVYVLLATAQFALRPALDLGAVVPLARASAFGRGYLDLELALALFALAAAISIAIDRPERPQRSVAELLAQLGGLGAAAACLLVPGISGHAGQTSPRWEALTLDWLHLAAGSVWIGGLIGLLVLWRSAGDKLRVAALSLVVPRFSRVAFVSVMILIGSGTLAALLHVPTLASLWQTSYGQALLVKIALLGTSMQLAAVNLLRTRPRLAAAAARPDLAGGAAVLLRRLVSGEVLLVVGILFAAGVLSSLAPPSRALATLGHVSARVGPGPVDQVVRKNGYRLAFSVDPNRAALPNSFRVRITRGGRPVRNAGVVARFDMLDMTMQEISYRLSELQPGVFARDAPALVMVGHWALRFEIAPETGQPFDVLLLDRASG